MIDYKNQLLSISAIYFVIAITLSLLFIGSENLLFNNIQWLFSGSDISGHQTGWNFFKNDEWRFPLGRNPNYGNEIGNSIVYSDSIPILALTFKLFNFLLPNNFQYFGFWFFICFFFQGFLSNLLIQKYTGNKIYSFLGSIFFIVYPILIYRMGFHPALFGQWTLIITVYLMLEKDKVNEKHWIFLILITALIHFYFTIINLIIYNFFKIYSFIISNEIKAKKYFKDIFICHLFLITLMYCVGYFEVRFVDTLALGFGVYKLNILSFVDSFNDNNGVSWSWFLPNISLTNGEEVEGFNYIGLGVLLLLIISVVFTIIDKKQREYLKFFLNKKVVIALFLIFLLSLSNKISFGSTEIITIPLYDIFYGLLSTVRSSGRLFWLISYFFLFVSIFFLYKKFGKDKSILFLLILLLIQLFDISAGLKNYLKLNQFINKDYILKDDFWYDQTKNIENILTTKPNNYNKNFNDLAHYINVKEFKKTNIVKTARIDRNKAALSRYKLNKDFADKKINAKTIYIIDNIGHLLTLKEIFKNDDVGFFFRDNIWSMIKDKKETMNNIDRVKLSEISIPQIKYKNNEIDENSKLLGLGWTHNFGKGGVWSEGNTSNLLLKINDKKNDYTIIELIIKPFVNEKINELDLDIFINEVFNSNHKFKHQKENSQNFKIKLKINNNLVVDNKMNIKFINKNPRSPLDILQSPDSRKIGFLLRNINLIN